MSAGEGATPAGGEQKPEPGRRARAIELAIVLLLLAPSFVPVLGAAPASAISFPVVASATILRDLGLLLLVLLFVSRAREGYAFIGWTLRNAWRETLLGVVAFVPIAAVIVSVEAALRALGASAPERVVHALRPSSALEAILAVVLVSVVSVAEETLFRGFMIRRFHQVTGRRALSIVLSTVLFALGHGYEGLAGMLTVGLFGLILSGIYLWRGSLVAPITIHFLQDAIAMAMLMRP